MEYSVKEDKLKDDILDEELRFLIDKRPREFSYYFKKYTPAIKKYARNLSDNKEDFEDVFQWGTFKLYLLYKLYGLDFPAVALAWVCVSIRNYMIDKVRKNKGYYLNSMPGSTLNITAMEDFIIRKLDIKNILNGNGSKNKFESYKYFKQGYSQEEIAEKLKISRQTVSKYIKESIKEINLYEGI